MSFRLRRHLGHFGLTLYAPSLLLVLLTCSFFWSPIHEILGRVTVHVTCLLILCAWVNEFPDNLPTDVSLSTALDVWLFGCFILVSASLLQFSVAHFLWRRKESKAAQRQPIVFKHGPSRSFFHEPPPLLQESETSTLLDRLSRFVFPAAFVLFNAIYWNGYCKEDRRHA